MPSSRMPGCSRFTRPGRQRDSLDEETTDWRAVCGKTARTVRRAGRGIPSRPLSNAVEAAMLGYGPSALTQLRRLLSRVIRGLAPRAGFQDGAHVRRDGAVGEGLAIDVDVGGLGGREHL